MKKLWHLVMHWFGCQPCTLVAIVHDTKCQTGVGIEHGCCDWHAIVRCAQCGEEKTL